MALASERNRASDQLGAVISAMAGQDARLAGFAETLFAGTPPDDVLELGDGLITDIARKASDAISAPFSGTTAVDWVSVAMPNGRTAKLFRIVNRDMPFLVDSTMIALQELDIDARLLLHPVFHSSRDEAGELTVLSPAVGKTAARDGAVVESLIVILAENLSDDYANQAVQDIRTALKDVAYAVADWRPMLDRLSNAVEALEKHSGNATEQQVNEAIAFCRWLLDGQFVFLGMREYALDGDITTGELRVLPDSNRGVLRDPNLLVLRRGTEMVELTPEIRRFYFAPQPLFVTKSNVVSHVHRSVHMDYVGLKLYAEDGRQTGELRIIGLFTSKIYTMPPAEIPMLRVKAEKVIADAGYVPGSHDAKALTNVIDTFPRDELFQIPVPTLCEWVPQIVELESRPRTRVFFRPDRFHRFVSALVYLPRERFSTAVREAIADILSETFGGEIAMFQPFFTEGRLVRVHFIVSRLQNEIPEADPRALEARIAEATRSWRDRLANALGDQDPEDPAIPLTYCSAFPASYTETHNVDRAMVDALRVEGLSDEKRFDVRLAAARKDHGDDVNAVIYSRDGAIPLSRRVPVFEQMGFLVLDEQTFTVRPKDGAVALHDMRLRPVDEGMPDLDGAAAQRLEECFLAVQTGAAESDNFNALILSAGASWRQAAALRAYGLFLRQANVPVGPTYMAETLNAYPKITDHLLKLFEVRFDPDLPYDMETRAEEEAGLRVDIETALADVPSLSEDRLLRGFLGLITRTVRTNFYQRSADGGMPETIAFKLDSRALEFLPEPRPFREIWVYSPKVEGVHLRFAPIARGGLRWSDRAQDFRTEVLGLCKAQQVKNTVIVPEGAKGGFYPKQAPKLASRDEIRANAVACYETFISTLLDITDNIVDGAIVPPPRVVRHDNDDPYLVVAADKGTATFSDYANAISLAKGHWLGDAFASGGSAGYDHKQMGITARGGWESVKRHFREMDRDIQTQPFTMAGVGDMSGDVFGNGALLSRATKLVAAFDHRDIFVDPDPDPETSFEERKRLFEMGRSSWQDYDKAKLSAGGGIFPRTSKSIELTDQIRQILDVTDKSLTPLQLITAILKAPVDLMWFGGIGTYIKADHESDEDVGDRANDAVRITAKQVRAKVIGEGANLGVTQPGRIAFAALGGKLNADFIDNSAGVNSSDIEVNIKIGLGAAMAAGKLDMPGRNTLLESMTEDVAERCLNNNKQQSLAISLATRDSYARLGYQSRLMRVLEQRGLLDRDLEDLPSEEALTEREAAGRGLERPEVAVLLSYAKIALSEDLMTSALADDPAFEPLLMVYFPPAMQEAYREEILSHRLRKEIIVTRITNSVINRAGPAAIVRLSDETGHTTGEIARAVMATRAVFDLPDIWLAIDALDNVVPGHVQLLLYGETQDLLLEQASVSLRLGGSATINDQIAADGPAVDRVRERLAEFATERQMSDLGEQTRTFEAEGVPSDLARSIATLELLRLGPASRVLSAVSGSDFDTAARAAFQAADRFRLTALRARITEAGYSDYYDRLASTSAMAAIEKATFEAARVLLSPSPASEARIAKASQRLSEVLETRSFSVSRLTVTASQVRDLLET